MMKCVLSLILLSYLCYSVELNVNLNGEVKKGLEELNKLYRKNKTSITPQEMMRVPSAEMSANAVFCVGVFARELKHLLQNMTVDSGSQKILTKLKGNLEALGPHEERDEECRMTERNKSLRPFNPYIKFIQTLNASKKR